MISSSPESRIPRTDLDGPLARAAGGVVIGLPELYGHSSQPIDDPASQVVTTTTKLSGGLTVTTTERSIRQTVTTVDGISGNPDLAAAVAGYVLTFPAHKSAPSQPLDNRGVPQALPQYPTPPVAPSTTTPDNEFWEDAVALPHVAPNEQKAPAVSSPPTWALGPRVPGLHLPSGPPTNPTESAVHLQAQEGTTSKDKVAIVRNVLLMAIGFCAAGGMYKATSGSDSFLTIVDDLANMASHFKR